MTMRTTAIALLALLSTPGCFWFTTKSEGEKLQNRVDTVESKVGGQQEKIDAKLAELEKVLKSATELLARNSADLGQDVKSLDADLRTMRGLLNEVKKYTDDLKSDITDLEGKMDQRDKVYQMKFDDLDKRLMALEAKAAGPQTPDDLWKEGKKAFDGGDYATARDDFKRLVVRFPSDDHADDAQYYRAESYMKEKSYEQAIIEFQKIFDKYSKSNFADDAFYRAGEAAEQMKSCREARAYYGALKARFPKSSLARKGAKRDAFLKKHAKNRKYCRK
jgi:tol-pal system protein YbgF